MKAFFSSLSSLPPQSDLGSPSFSTRLGRSPSGVAGLSELLRANLFMSCTCKSICASTNSELGMTHLWETMALRSLEADHSQVPFWYHFELLFCYIISVFDRNNINSICTTALGPPFLQPYDKNWTALRSSSWCCLGSSATEPWVSGLLSGSLWPPLL